MAERFAMYNLFLGLRAATQSYDPGCAVAVLNATRAGAVAWNRTHEDPDTAADLMLIDQYLANLREHGANPGSERPVSSCATASEPYPDGPYPYGDDVGYSHAPFTCSSGGPSGGLPILLGAFAALGLRRRRR
jgi:MYXO-CTERM domain-containing protein